MLGYGYNVGVTNAVGRLSGIIVNNDGGHDGWETSTVQ